MFEKEENKSILSLLFACSLSSFWLSSPAVNSHREKCNEAKSPSVNSNYVFFSSFQIKSEFCSGFLCLSERVVFSDFQKKSIFCLIQSGFVLLYWFVPFYDKQCCFDKTVSLQTCLLKVRCRKCKVAKQLKKPNWDTVSTFRTESENLISLQGKCLDTNMWANLWQAMPNKTPYFSPPRKSFDFMRFNLCAQAIADTLMWLQGRWQESSRRWKLIFQGKCLIWFNSVIWFNHDWNEGYSRSLNWQECVSHQHPWRKLSWR